MSSTICKALRGGRHAVGALALLAFLQPPLGAEGLQDSKKAWDYAWDEPMRGRHDQPIIDKLGKGWFMNLGPTGVRAKITHELPCYFTATFVFEDSPAAGKVKAGDVVVGANGRIMNVPHVFGGTGTAGVEGPLMEMSRLIEEAQAKDGKLDLILWPGGDRGKQKSVPIKIEASGRFSPTFPFDCDRSDRLLRKLCDFLEAEYKHDGHFVYMVHSSVTATLALMSTGNPRYAPIIKKVVDGYTRETYGSDAGGTWDYGLKGILLGEYFLQTRDPGVLPAIQAVGAALGDGMSWASGSYSHYVYPEIMRRVHKEGTWGYGPMSGPGGFAMTAMSLFKEAGLRYPLVPYERFHQSFLNSVEADGSIGYGFKNWDCAILKLKNPSKPESRSERGIGYLCPKGLKGLGEFTVVPAPGEGAKPDDTSKDKSWLTQEADRVKVYDMGGDLRCAVRDMTRPEPAQPWAKGDRPTHHYMRMGLGSLAHHIGNADRPTWRFLGDHMANACVNSYKGLTDGHASSLLHTLWGTLGAARAEPAKFRKYMDYIKWWFIMSEAHNGGFVLMPGRDYGPTDHVYGNRNLITATAALILSLKDRRLRITGAASAAASKTAKKTGVEKPGPEKTGPDVATAPKTDWDLKLRARLSAALKGGREIGFHFSLTNAQVRCASVSEDGEMLLSGGGLEARYTWKLLPPKDRGRLAASLAASNAPEDLALAAYFQLGAGQSKEAEDFLRKLPEETRREVREAAR